MDLLEHGIMVHLESLYDLRRPPLRQIADGKRLSGISLSQISSCLRIIVVLFLIDCAVFFLEVGLHHCLCYFKRRNTVVRCSE